MEKPLVAVIMGSSSDWDTMRHAVDVLERFGVPHERQIVSAHRTPGWMAEYVGGAEARGVEVIEPSAPLPHPEVVREADFHGPLGIWRREAGRRIRLSDHTPVGAAYALSTASDTER